MYSNKNKSFAMQTEHLKPLLESFALLFYICKILGLNSQDWGEFRRFKRLKKSAIGDRLVVFGIIIALMNFNSMTFAFRRQYYTQEKSFLAIGIGFVLTYFSLALFISDRVNALLKQQYLIDIFQELEEIDRDFSDLNIHLNNNYIKYRLMAGIIIATFVEGTLVNIAFVLYVDKINWTDWLWLYSCVPTYFNSLDTLWYIGILMALRKRFEVLNKAFEMEALNLEQERRKQDKLKSSRKLNKKAQVKKNVFENCIRPEGNSFQTVFGDVVVNPPMDSPAFENNIYATENLVTGSSDSSPATDSFNTSLEHKFSKYCQLHDSLCEVGKQLSRVYGFPTLMLMGYGFLILTAQLYFFYAANMGQAIPTMFRSAQSWWITAIYLIYISTKCINIFYGNWLTSLESKKTGVCIHRCAMAADQNFVYEMINHLSLKLFNHSCNFNACGYFPLNMTTLFSFCGSITTYLIILIQFNLEEQQVKIKTENGKPMAIIQDNFTINENVVNGTRSNNTTSLLDLFYQI